MVVKRRPPNFVNNYITLTETATTTNVSDSTLRNWIRRGLVKAFKSASGRCYYFHRDQIPLLKAMAEPISITPGGCYGKSGSLKDQQIDQNISEQDSKPPVNLREELLNISDDAKRVLGEKVIEYVFDMIVK